MPKLFFAESNKPIGEITQEQLEFLQDMLEEEGSDDRDYYINVDTLEMFEEEGADESLITLLKGALGDQEEMDIGWSEQ
jgi:hypothetical protein